MISDPKKYGLAAMQRQGTVRLADALRDYQQRNPPGMPEKPAKPHPNADPHCKKCDGYGYRKSTRYHTWFICSCPVDAREKYLTDIQPQPSLQRIGLTQDEIDRLKWSMVKPDISDGHLAVGPVRDAYERGHGLIFLYGSYGQAKTLIGKILVATAYREGKSASYANMASVLDDIRLSFDTQHQNTELLRRMEYWIQRDVLFLDELGRTNETGWAKERIFQLLDQRYTRAIREQSLTVLASNTSNGELDGYVASRLQDQRVGPIIHLNGPDGREVMPKGYKY